MKNVKSGHKAPAVCLDAGHYGKYNRSPVVPEYYESEMNRKLCGFLASELEGKGIEVWPTRLEQTRDLEVTARGRTAKGADLFLSIHSNASSKESSDSPLGIYLVDDDCGAIDEQSKAIAALLSQVVAEVMETKDKPRTYSRLSSGDRDGDGKKNDDYYGVLYGAHQVGTAGVILEHSYHTNTRATRWLLEEENLKKLAKAEAEVIARWFGLEDGELPQEEPEEAEKPETNHGILLPQLKKGSEAAQVKALQALLLGYGYDIGRSGVDGIFGGATDAALRKYQSRNGLAVDGIAGPKTWAKLLGV